MITDKSLTIPIQDITFSDLNPGWDVLRRVMHVAIRKYSQTEKLAHLVATKVDNRLSELFNEETHSEVEIVEFLEDIVFKLMAESAFGG